MSATISRPLKTLAAAAKKSWAAIPLPGAAGAGDFSPIPLIAFLVFVLGRPYRGIVQDPQIDIGRAVADLDPSGMGRDLIAPFEQGKELPAGIEMKLWRLPEPQFQLTKGDGAYVWRKIDAFGVIPCAGQEPAKLRMPKQ